MSDNQEIPNISEIYGYDDVYLTDSAYPIRYYDFAKAQKNDAKLKQNLVSQKTKTLTPFVGAITTIFSYSEIEKYAYLRHYRGKL